MMYSNLGITATLYSDSRIAQLFRKARRDLERIGFAAHGAKMKRVRKLAEDLERSGVPKYMISTKIIHNLAGSGLISKSTIHAALSEKYKVPYRVRNAKAQKKNEPVVDDAIVQHKLAPELALNKPHDSHPSPQRTLKIAIPKGKEKDILKAIEFANKWWYVYAYPDGKFQRASSDFEEKLAGNLFASFLPGKLPRRSPS